MSKTTKELFKIDFCKIVKFDCKCGRRYINTSNCRQCTDGYEKQTNADRIRSMTDDELAEFLIKVNTAYAEPCMTGEKDCKWEDYPTRKMGCKDCFKEWLEREVEE